MNILDVLKEAFTPRKEIERKLEEKSSETEQIMRGHLRKLEQTAIRHVTESTDDAAEFHHVRRN